MLFVISTLEVFKEVIFLRANTSILAFLLYWCCSIPLHWLPLSLCCYFFLSGLFCRQTEDSPLAFLSIYIPSICYLYSLFWLWLFVSCGSPICISGLRFPPESLQLTADRISSLEMPCALIQVLLVPPWLFLSRLLVAWTSGIGPILLDSVCHPHF